MKNIVKIEPKFSFFNGPITNKYPKTNVTIADIYRGITSDYYKETIESIRNTENPKIKRRIKQNLDYVTFGGTFSCRSKEDIIEPSGYVCIDLDHLEAKHIQTIKSILLNDGLLETELLFISPSCKGLKWVVYTDNDFEYEINFIGIVGYLKATYPKYFNLTTNYIDETGKDISRACFMSYDPTAFINEKYKYNGRF